MAWFGSRNKQGTRGTPGEQYNRNNNPVIHRPADAPDTAAPAASAQQNQQVQQNQQPEQKPAERPLSYISLEYRHEDKVYGILILHEIDDGEQPQRIEQVIDRWKNMPKANRFDVLSFPRHFYCINRETGQVDMSVELPEDYAKLAQKEQDDRVREFMAKLTGEKPAAPVAGTLTAELINATSTEALVDIAYNMKREDRQRVVDAFMKANKKRRQEADARRQQSGGGEGGEGKKPEQPAQRQQPVRQPASQATGLGAVRRRRGG